MNRNTHTFPDSWIISIHWTCSSSDSAARTMVPWRETRHTDQLTSVGLTPRRADRGGVPTLTVKSSRLTTIAKGIPRDSLADTTHPPRGMTPWGESGELCEGPQRKRGGGEGSFTLGWMLKRLLLSKFLLSPSA